MKNGGSTTDFWERSRRWSLEHQQRSSEGSGRFSAIYESYADPKYGYSPQRPEEYAQSPSSSNEPAPRKKTRLTFRKLVLAFIVITLPAAAMVYPDFSNWLSRGRAYLSSLVANDELVVDYQDASQQSEEVPPVQDAPLAEPVSEPPLVKKGPERSVPLDDPFLPAPVEEVTIAPQSFSSEESIPQEAMLELERLGAVSNRLQRWGDGFWRFSCRVQFRPETPITYEIEAVGASADDAIALVCQKIKQRRQEY